MVVGKEILYQYMDLQQEIEEVRGRIKRTEEQLDRIEKEGAVKDKVMGGEGGNVPYTIEGFPVKEYSKKKTLLDARKNMLSNLEMDLLEQVTSVEEFISGIKDSHIRRIINLRVIDNLTWNDVAIRMGVGYTKDSVRMTFERFMAKK